MKSAEIRKKFLEYFAKRDHKIVPSSSLVPSGDSSVLLTTAGMQQFKRYYTGELDAEKDFVLENGKSALGAASIQKCFRTSDIDSVGDKSHLTFFEMLGNFSFGGYFKEGAIKWAWEFITQEMKIAPERCSVSVFAGDPSTSSGQVVPEDNESIEIWKSLGLTDDKIKKCGRKDNFWGPTGDEGPCGPTSEIYIDGMEVWNLVFNEYYCSPDKNLKPLGRPGVDTGMGLERLAMVMQNKKNIFETDLFKPLGETNRIALDHGRAITFLISDGTRPSNKEQGYILRRLMRRLMAKKEIESTSIENLLKRIIEEYKNFYPELNEELVLSVFREENSKFQKAIRQGLRELEKLETLDAVSTFRLFESYGLTFEVIKDFAGTKAENLNRSDFDEEFKKHQEISRAGADKKFGGHGIEISNLKSQSSKLDESKIIKLHTATHLLHQALHDVLGKKAEIKQMGSDINAERARFDFSFPRKLTPEEINKIENIVNEKIKLDLPVFSQKMNKENAMRLGARAFFKDKYPDEVNIYSIGDSDLRKAYSKELCAGPHVDRTSEIGRFKIIKEESSSAGVRRVRIVVE